MYGLENVVAQEAPMSVASIKNDPQLQLLPSPAAAEGALVQADRKYAALKAQILGPELDGESAAGIERLLHREGFEVLRLLFQGCLENRSLNRPEGPVIGDDGVERTHGRKDTERTLATIFGDVAVTRIAWTSRGADARHPTDGELNLPSVKYSLELQRQISIAAAQMPFEASIESVERTTAGSIPKRQAEETVVSAARDFDAYYQEHYPAMSPADTSEILVLTLDQKGVVVVPRDLREATRKVAGTSRRKLETRLSRGEKPGRKRMATVAAVYTVGPHVRTPGDIIAGLKRKGERVKRPRPEEKRVWASLQKPMKEVIAEAFDEAERRDPKATKRWFVVIDGDPDLEAAVEAEAKRRKRQVSLVLDFIHALEYLWRASTAFYPETSPEREGWVLERLQRLLEGKCSDVAAGMRRSAMRRGLTGAARKAVDTCANYFLRRKHMMRYHEVLLAGAPIASGVIEGACRHLVKDRMELTGARWTLERADAVLQLRALLVSDDFDDYWRFHEKREQWRNHASRYQDHRVPRTVKSRPTGHLRLVTQ